MDSLEEKERQRGEGRQSVTERRVILGYIGRERKKERGGQTVRYREVRVVLEHFHSFTKTDPFLL